MARGEGAIVEDVDGNRFLDCAAGIAVNSTGHAHPRGRRRHRRAGAASSCTCRAPTSTTSRRCGWPRRFAASCRSTAASSVFFSNSGTEANEARHQAGALSHQAAVPDRVPRLVPRPHARLARADVEPRRAAQGLRAGDDAGRLPCAVPGLYRCRGGRVAGAGRRRVDRLDRGSAVREPRVAGRGRGDRRRADPGRGRLHRAADRVPPAAAASWRRSTASCWSSTRCSRAWAGPGRCSPRSTSA